MTQINPLLGSVLQTPQAQKQQAADRMRLVRQANESRRESTNQENEIIHEVEEGAQLAPVEDSHEHPQNKEKRKAAKDELPSPGSESEHIDLTA